MKNLVVKTLLDKNVKEAAIEVLAYILDQPNSKEIFSNYLNDVFLRKDVLDNLSTLFVDGAAITLQNPQVKEETQRFVMEVFKNKTVKDGAFENYVY